MIVAIIAVALIVAGIAYIRKDEQNATERTPPRMPPVHNAPGVTVSPEPPAPPKVDAAKAAQAAEDIRHYARALNQYEELRQTIQAEIDAIRATREKKAQLAKLHGNPALYVDIAAEIDPARDISERREAALQRQLITLENNIHNTRKRLAKARQAATE